MNLAHPARISGSAPIALVTGASSGIGREFARRSAREGFDVVLVARTESALELLADELSREHGVAVMVHPADLSTSAGLTSLSRAMDALPRLDHLVNCAGLAPEGDLARADIDELERMVHLNITTVTALTRAAVIRMRAAGGGSIINVASAAGYQPTPYLAAYGASKSYVRMFSEAISEENRAHRVRVLSVSPGDTDTAMNPGSGRRKRRPEQVVETAWRALRSSAPSVVDGRGNRLTAFLASRVLPTKIALRIAERMFRSKA